MKIGNQRGREREKMIKRLYEASVSGSVPSLLQLMEEDKLILDRVTITSFNETPLHIAAMRGHLEFAREILRHKPRLASELDSESYSPLHLASAEGNLEMVKELLKVNSSICCATDIDGRNPLHLAAIKGRIDVMKELIQACPEVIHARVDKGESILHSCVKYNRLEALKLLLESPSAQGLLNCKDDDGNTPLHLAAAKKLAKGIELLLEKNIELNALNANGLTALDILAQSPREMRDMDIGESLRAAGALRAKNIRSSTARNANDNTNATVRGSENTHDHSSRIETGSNQTRSRDRDGWLEEKKNSLMIVSTVIATMAFQAVLSPPGGVWQEGNKAGKPIMADQDNGRFLMFFGFNSLSFVGSLGITLLLMSGLPLKRRLTVWILMVSMWVIISSLLWTYFQATTQLAGIYSELNGILAVALTIWFGLMCFVLILHTARWVLWCMKGLSLKRKVSVWISIVLVAVAMYFVIGLLFGTEHHRPISLFAAILLITLSIWGGMVGFLLLLHVARLVSRCMNRWWKTVDQLGHHQSMIDQNQSSV